jgi:hypothetical protein
MITGLLFLPVAMLVDAALARVVTAITPWEGGVFVLVFANALGVVAYLLRRYALALYAALEIFVGLYGAASMLALLYAPEPMPEGMKQWAAGLPTPYPLYVALLAAIYIMVRGLDNGEKYLAPKLAQMRAPKPPTST